MKKLNLIFTVLLAMTFTSCVTYKVIQVNEPFVKVYDNLEGDKTLLFLKANEWMVKNFKNASSVIEYSDKTEGVLLGKYLLFGETRSTGYGIIDTRVYAKIDIRVKDSKARVSIEPIGNWKYDASGATIYSYSLEKANEDMGNLSDDLYLFLKSKKVEF